MSKKSFVSRQVPANIIPATVSYNLKNIKALTENQKLFFNEWKEGQNILLSGSSGTGKSIISLYSALKTVFDRNQPQTHIMIVRSTVQTREQGFVKGSIEEKQAPFESIYRNIISDLIEVNANFDNEFAYDRMKQTGIIKFISTAFIRGETFKNCVVIVDEWENMWGSELASIVTRLGENSRIILCGDLAQTDLKKAYEREGFKDFIKVIKNMKEFTNIDFTIDDVVRSSLCKAFLQSQYNLKVSFL